MSKPAYATWMLVLQLGAYATLFDGGLQISIGRFVARAEKAGDRGYMGAILSSATAVLAGGAVVALLAVVFASLRFQRLFHSIPAALVPQASMTLLLVAGALALTFPASVLAGFSLGLEENQVNAVAGSASKFVGAGGAVWAAVHHQGLIAMGAWTAAGTLVQPAIFAFANRRRGLRSLIRVGLVRAGTMWEFARFCSAMMASQLGMLLIAGLDLPIVVAYDFRDAGYYALATTASSVLAVPFGAVLSTLVPVISGMSMGTDAEQMGRVLVRTTRLATTMLALIAVPLMVGMPVLLRLWVGADYARHTLLFAELLVAAQLVRLTLAPYTLIAFSAGEQGKVLFSSVGEGIVNLLLSLVLVRHMGAAGVAMGTLVGAAFGIAVHFWNSMARTHSMQFERKLLLLRGIVAPLAWALPVAGLLALLLSMASAKSLQVALLCGCVVLLAALFWKATLRTEDRMVARELASRVLSTALRPRRIEV